MTSLKMRAALAVCGVLSASGPVYADAVTDWNEITLSTVAGGRPGGFPILDVALVQVAVHDAVQAFDKRYEPYYMEVDNAPGRREAAVAAASHDVLVGLYPAQAESLHATYARYLVQHGLANDPGLRVGEQVAAGILPLRRGAPNPLPPPFVGGTAPGDWRPTDSFIGNPPFPPPFAPMAASWLGGIDPYTLTGPARFRAVPPPALTSDLYRKDYKEVKDLGMFASTVRTQQQTDLAYFYSDDFFAQWNRALRAISIRYVPRISDRARLFALANLATADAVITAWDSKKHYALWRPLTAIREGDDDGNPHTVGDPGWQPLVNTPNYPDYTSGANNVTGAMTRTLALFFGTDRVRFDITSRAPLAVQKTRTYHRFSEAAQDVVDARVYQGIHFRFADTAARTQGTRVADWTFHHFLLPRGRHGKLDRPVSE